MIDPIKRRLQMDCRRPTVVEEFGVGYGVADVVAAVADHRAIDERRQLGRIAAHVDRGSIRVLQALQGRTLGPDEIVTHTGLSTRGVRAAVALLIAQHFVAPTKAGKLKLTGRYRPVAREIWAVEAKTKNWFQGLCQARRYQHFAHRVYLALLAVHKDRVDPGVLRAVNVGLILVDATEATIVFHPRRARPRNPELFLRGNETLWASRWSASVGRHVSPAPETPVAMS